MKGKKVKSRPSSRRAKRKAPKENVQSSTSLPPLVEGQLRCYLRVSVSKIIWIVPNSPDTFHVRLCWWGEITNGTIYRPLDVKNPTKSTTKSIARFPIRCGPKQFATYLNDMESLVFEVLRGSTMILIGKAQVNEIGHLTPTTPINGFFTVFSSKSADKIAELQISLVFEPLPATYESSSSVPTTDVSMVRREPRRQAEHTIDTNRQQAPKLKQVTHGYSASSNDPFTSPKPKAPHKTNVDSDVHASRRIDNNVDSDVHAPRGIDSDYSFVIGPGTQMLSGRQQTFKDTTSKGSRLASQPMKEQYTESSISGADAVKYPSIKLNPHTGIGLDLISSLLDRGTRLRKNMIQAELESRTGQTELPPTTSINPNPSRPASGDLLREILLVNNTTQKQQGKHALQIADTNLDTSEIDLELRTVDLILGDKVSNEMFKILQNSQEEYACSLSSNSDVTMSEVGDPIHDQTILEDLFYKNTGSSSDDLSDVLSSDEDVPSKSTNRSMSIDDPGNIRPPSRKSSKLYSQHGSQDTPSEANKLVHKNRQRNSIDDDDDDESDSRSLSGKSEGSRVSFDERIIDSVNNKTSDIVEGLSVERLTLLGRIHVARVSVDHLTFDDAITVQTATPSRTPKSRKIKSRPPRPAARPKRKRTYLVEYKFPVVAASRDGGGSITTATEVIRLASKKVEKTGVSFGHHSVFPVRFDGSTVDKWWHHLLDFKIFVRTAGQKTPEYLGVTSVPLRSVIQSSELCLQVKLPVLDKRDPSWSNAGSNLVLAGLNIGHLTVLVELASDSKDFKHDLANVKVAEIKGSRIVPIPSQKQLFHIIPIKQGQPDTNLTQGTQTKHRYVESHKNLTQVSGSVEEYGHYTHTEQQSMPSTQSMPGTQSMPATKSMRATHSEIMTLHCILHIPLGKGLTLHGIHPPTQSSKLHPPPKPHSGHGVRITGRDMVTRNSYLISRMFWSDSVVQSKVCWGTTEPNYDFLQIAPVLMTSSLLERTRNNFMIIEVWDKKTSAQNDQLVGIVKLPLHQLYMYFRDFRIVNALLKSKFPVVAVDNVLPVIDPFSGVKNGELKVLLALGSQGQISEIQRAKLDREGVSSYPDRPAQFLERADELVNNDSVENQMIEHVFEVVVEGIRGFPQFQDTVWGECDTFIQYHFPTQAKKQQTVDQTIKHAPPTLKPHKTATTLCLPDPVFHDVCRHRLSLASRTPVQRALLTACAGVGGAAGGIPFEVWCRYYYPNIRDQVLAKATLPLAKLCAMVTMQKRGETSVQSFSLPLKPQVQEDETDTMEHSAKLHDAGLLDVTIHYKTAILRSQSEYGLSPSKALGSQVCIAVSVLRACGLKAAAKLVANHDAGMQYPSDVGVNCYVKIILSFLSMEEIRITRSVARNFAPEFAHTVDFPCPLWFNEDSSVGGVSLAEVLETCDITFQVWHQVPGFKPDHDVKVVDTSIMGTSVTAQRLFTSSGDILLGSCILPLRRLLTSKTGIKGWHPLYIPPLGWDNAADSMKPSQLPTSAQATHSPTERIAGGLEICITLAHQNDQERVIHAARSLGWAPDDSLEDVEEWQQHDDAYVMLSEVGILIELAVFPVSCALRVGQKHLDKHANAYIRYKFYDKGAVLSKLCYIDVDDSVRISVDLKHTHRLHVHSTLPFLWYLKEEHLEIQLWISYSNTTETRPRQRDKLIGCAYMDLSPLSKASKDTQRISGLYPVFKPGAAHLGGAYLKAHVTRKIISQHYQDSMDGDGTLSDDSGIKQRHRTWKQKEEAQKMEEEERVKNEEAVRLQVIEEERRRKEDEEIEKGRPVLVHVVIDQAMHVTCDAGFNGLNTFYISYQTTDGVITSSSVTGSARIIWGFEHESKVNKDVLDNQVYNLLI